jgi:mRNA-degrading endonuclease RelE of RelBE toxin-antitoxin system
MSFDIVLTAEAVEDGNALKANLRAEVRDAIETHLRHEPRKTSRSRIKRLRGLQRPQYRLRVGDIPVFYDVLGNTVEVLGIVAKSEADAWLIGFGSPE